MSSGRDGDGCPGLDCGGGDGRDTGAPDAERKAVHCDCLGTKQAVCRLYRCGYCG